MGQAFRRASGRIRVASSADAPPSSLAAAAKSAVDRRPPVGPAAGEEISKSGESIGPVDSDGSVERNVDNVLEERDPQFNTMLSQMVGRIRTKPGGKPEMGEAFVVEKYKRPLPKLRNTKSDSSRYEERPTPAGTLNVVQLRHIVLLHEGKADDHEGPMDAQQIAEKFQIDAAEVRRILQFISLPPEDKKKDENNF